jgi:hypothetical protein
MMAWRTCFSAEDAGRRSTGETGFAGCAGRRSIGVADREKVIEGFDICLKNIDSPDCPSNCPYFSDCSKYENRVVFQPLMRDALAMLKEQEAVEPIKQTEQTEWIVCGHCRKHLISKWMFCPYCGRAAKWDD